MLSNTACAVHATIFSTSGKFLVNSNRFQILPSYTLVLKPPVLMRSWLTQSSQCESMTYSQYWQRSRGHTPLCQCAQEVSTMQGQCVKTDHNSYSHSKTRFHAGLQLALFLTDTLVAISTGFPFVMSTNWDVSTESIQTGLFLTPNSFTSGQRSTHTWWRKINHYIKKHLQLVLYVDQERIITGG